MKYFIAIALIAAVASAGVIKPIIGHAQEVQQVQEIINAINSPSTDPATAVLLEHMLNDMFVQKPVQVGPAIIEQSPAVVEGISPIAAGPASVEMHQVQEIVNAINSPSTNPATAAVLEQILHDILGQQPVQVQDIINAINSPSTDPASAALLEQMLHEMLVQKPVQVGPAIVEQNPAIIEGVSPIVVGPTAEMQQVQEIINAINSPSTDPATAVLLEQMLHDILGQQPVQVGPVVVEQNPAIVEGVSPISVGPAIIDFPLPDGGAVTEVESTPAVVAPGPAIAAPVASEQPAIVQIIVNVNAAAAGNNPVSVIAPEAVVQPAPVAEPAVKPELVTVVDTPVIIPSPVVLPEPVQPVVVVPELVHVAEPVIPEPVAVAVPVIPEPVAVAVPVIPEPVAIAQPAFPIGVQPVVLPETLN